MSTRRRLHRAFTLPELLAVVAILGIVSAIAMARMNPAALSNVGSQTDARRLALDLLAAQRRTIATGDNHYLLFTDDDGQLLGYRLYRAAPGGDAAVDSYHPFPAGVAVTGSRVRAEFSFDGSALAAYRYTLKALDRTWQVQVVAATGTVQVAEL